jgi:hypothetical protein
MTVAAEPLFPVAFSALPVRSTHYVSTPTSTTHRAAVEKILDYYSLVQYIFIPPEQFHIVVQYDHPRSKGPMLSWKGVNDVRARSDCA